MCDNLPEVVLKHIFSFVGNAWDFRCCERTCKTFRQALEDDAVWASCEECKPEYQEQQPYWPTLNREKAFVVRALDKCHHWQRSSKSVLRSVLTVREWKHLVQQALKLLLLDDLIVDGTVKCCDTFPLRGDTSALLMALVENCLVQQLQRANSIGVFLAVQTPKTQDASAVFLRYPSVSNLCFAMQDHMMNFNNSPTEDMQRGPGYLLTLMPSQRIQAITATISRHLDLDREKRHSIVRRLAYRAGVSKLEDETFSLVWNQMVSLIVMLLKPGIISLASRNHYFAHLLDGEPQLLRGLETMRNIPPPMEYAEANCQTCNNRQVIHTIVPQQIEEAAKQLGISQHFWCAEWHVDTELEDVDKQKLLKQEIATAQSKYCLVGVADGDRGPVGRTEETEFDDEDSYYTAKEDEDALDDLSEVSKKEIAGQKPTVPTEVIESDDDESYVPGRTSEEDEDALEDLSDVSLGEIADLQAEAAEMGVVLVDAVDDASDEEISLAGVWLPPQDAAQVEIEDNDNDSDSYSFDSDSDDESYTPQDTSSDDDDLECYEEDGEVLVSASFGENHGPVFSRDFFAAV